MQDYVEQAGRGRILQVSYSDWSYADGEQKARQLLPHYRDANLLWAGHHSMALGALKAVKASGRPLLIGGMGGWTEALDSIAHGEMAATVADHCLIGAWALALLHDHFHGPHFAAQDGPNVMLDYLSVVTREHLLRPEWRSYESLSRLDFSKVPQISQVAHAKGGSTVQRVKRLLDGIWGM